MCNFTQYCEPNGMDNWVYTQAQEAVDENNISYLKSLVSSAETWPRDVICEEYRKAHGTAKAEADLGVTFL